MAWQDTSEISHPYCHTNLEKKHQTHKGRDSPILWVPRQRLWLEVVHVLLGSTRCLDNLLCIRFEVPNLRLNTLWHISLERAEAWWKHESMDEHDRCFDYWILPLFSCEEPSPHGMWTLWFWHFSCWRIRWEQTYPEAQYCESDIWYTGRFKKWLESLHCYQDSSQKMKWWKAIQPE